MRRRFKLSMVALLATAASANESPIEMSSATPSFAVVATSNAGTVVYNNIPAAGYTHPISLNAYTVATSKDGCKGTGWQSLTRADASGFKNQGDCVS